MGAVLKREQFFEKPVEKLWVPLPKLGDGSAGVYVRMLSGADRDEIERQMVGLEPKERLKNIRARLTVLTACDEAGERIFSEAEAGELGKRVDHETLDAIFEAARKMNKIFVQENEEKDAEKN